MELLPLNGDGSVTILPLACKACGHEALSHFSAGIDYELGMIFGARLARCQAKDCDCKDFQDYAPDSERGDG